MLKTLVLAVSCISLTDLYRQSITYGSCYENYNPMPDIPAGWHWLAEWDITYDEPQPCHWRSWPDNICESE